MSSAAAAPASSARNGSNLGKRARDSDNNDNEQHESNGNGVHDNVETSDDDDDDLGPMPMPATADDIGSLSSTAGPASKSVAAAKKRKILRHEKVFLDNVPSADRYYSTWIVYSIVGSWLSMYAYSPLSESFMHRDLVSHTVVTKWVHRFSWKSELVC